MRSLVKTFVDRFKSFARLGRSLFIADDITSISATMRGKRASDDLAKSTYPFKDENPENANSTIARILSISESTLKKILKRRIGRSDRQKIVKLGQKSVLIRSIKRRLLGRVNRKPKLLLSGLLLKARRLVSNATAHCFLKNRGFRNRVADKTFLGMLKKIEELTGAVDIYFRLHKSYFQRRNCYFSGKKIEKIYVYRKSGQKFLPRFGTRTSQVLQQGSVTIWGYMFYWCFGCLKTFIGTMDSQHYVEETLENYVQKYGFKNKILMKYVRSVLLPTLSPQMSLGRHRSTT